MANDTVISVEGLSKRYRLGHAVRHDTLRDALAHRLSAPWQWLRNRKLRIENRKSEEEFWALRDVTFEVKRAEIVGIIGRNGAGKSTLLKILSRITEPTTGRVTLQGRVASLLEVGTGFHPELTGRENVFLNGAILGMSRTEIRRKFDEIVAFAEVEKFLDTPVKHYSSGMYVRLAFAVAAHLEPEILIVDEVLAVGDVQFQQKCLGKMQDVSTQEGRTVLFVSHNLPAVVRLCHRTLLLEGGRLVLTGQPREVLSRYLGRDEVRSGEVTWPSPNHQPIDSGAIRVLAVRLRHPDGATSGLFHVEDEILLEIAYELRHAIHNVWIGFKVTTETGDVLLCAGDQNFAVEPQVQRLPGRFVSRCRLPPNLFNQGVYQLSLMAHQPGRRVHFDSAQVLAFEVIQKHAVAGGGIQPGWLRPLFVWERQSVKESAS